MLRASTLATFDSRGVAVPLFPNIVNFGLDRFDHVAAAIDALPREDAEWAKVPVLVNEPSYLAFLTRLTGASEPTIVGYLNDFRDDAAFAAEMAAGLADLDHLAAAGDLRFHAITLYVVVRALRPERMVETGVAHGKSSSFALLGMDHNGAGSLCSIDLPPDGNLADGSLTSMSGRPTGWLVPERLRTRWELLLGDSLELLPGVLAAAPADLFFHDSLHTFEHTTTEIELALAAARGPITVLVDNIDMGSGFAFAEVLQARRLVGYGYRDFGGALVP